jgi:hypothetical protein
MILHTILTRTFIYCIHSKPCGGDKFLEIGVFYESELDELIIVLD